MNELPINAVMKRLDLLEQENHRLKLMGVGAAVIAGLVFLLGAAGSKESGVVEDIRARRFILVDKIGTLRAQLTVNQNDVTVLEMLDPIGKGGVTMIANVHRGSLSVAGRNGSAIGLYVQDSPSLSLYSKNGNADLWLGVPSPTRKLEGTDMPLQDTLIGLQLVKGQPSFIINDSNRNPRVVLGHTELKVPSTGVVVQQPASSIVLFNEAGNVIWSKP
jgi:hypothetical protein